MLNAYSVILLQLFSSFCRYIIIIYFSFIVFPDKNDNIEYFAKAFVLDIKSSFIVNSYLDNKFPIFYIFIFVDYNLTTEIYFYLSFTLPQIPLRDLRNKNLFVNISSFDLKFKSCLFENETV